MGIRGEFTPLPVRRSLPHLLDVLRTDNPRKGNLLIRGSEILGMRSIHIDAARRIDFVSVLRIPPQIGIASC
ncbi:hypothetical protein GCM10010388_30790 [Streptomyces mauvecolor]